MPAKLPHTEPSRRSKKKVVNFQRNQRAVSTVSNPTVKAPAMLDKVASTVRPPTRERGQRPKHSMLHQRRSGVHTTSSRCKLLGWRKFIREKSQADDWILPVYHGSGPVVVVDLALFSRWCGPLHHVRGGSP